MTKARKHESKKAAMLRLRPFECTVPALIFEGQPFSKTVFALSRGQARYQCLLDLHDAGWEVAFKDIVVRGGAPSMSALAAFADTANYRGVPFARIGMRVECAGHPGVIVGHNDSANFQVFFTSGPYKGTQRNCHPCWMMKYFDCAGALIAEFHA